MRSSKVERKTPQFSMKAFVAKTPLPCQNISEFLANPEKRGLLLTADF
jgi:hypothetical protein